VCWIVFEVKGDRYVWIEEGDLLMARLKASLAGQVQCRDAESGIRYLTPAYFAGLPTPKSFDMVR
jgi:hypothetical protein